MTLDSNSYTVLETLHGHYCVKACHKEILHSVSLLITTQKLEKKNAQLQELVIQSHIQKESSEELEPTTLKKEKEQLLVVQIKEQLLLRTQEVETLGAELRNLRDLRDVSMREKVELLDRLVSADSVCAMQREAFQGDS